MKRRLILALAACAGILAAQEPPPQPQISLTRGAGDTWNADWQGVGGCDRVYFFEWSLDLRTWRQAPFMAYGAGLKSYGFQAGGAPKFFVRLNYVDVPGIGSLAAAEAADFDGDGLSNLAEISQYATAPLAFDSDGDGTGDGLEVGAGSDPNDPQSGGTPIARTFESKWLLAAGWDDLGGMGLTYAVGGSDSLDNGWLTAHGDFGQFPSLPDYAAHAALANAFPLPPGESGWQDEGLAGMAWTHASQDAVPYGGPRLRRHEAGRLVLRMRVNKPAPGGPDGQGYEYPLQVLRVPWETSPDFAAAWEAVEEGATVEIHKFRVPKGATLSQEIELEAPESLAENRSETVTPLIFEEMEPESGFDDHVRYAIERRSSRPALCVADSATPAAPATARVKLHFVPMGRKLKLSVNAPGGRTVSVEPEEIETSPVELLVTGSGWGGGENAFEGELEIEGRPVLDLHFYRRREVTLAVHAITLINDDVEQAYVKQSGQPAEPIALGEGAPDRHCIGLGANGILDTVTAQGDDVVKFSGVYTGPNGICETSANGDDQQIIGVGKGYPHAVIVTAGPNGELNTAPNAPDANVAMPGGGVANPQDDAIADGTTITTGADGIRQTPVPRPRQEPVNLPSQGDLQDYLDRTFGKQANIWFDIVDWNEADAAFDVAATEEPDSAFSELQRPNHFFDFFAGAYESKEEIRVKAASYDAEATFNLYYIGAPLQQNYDNGGVQGSSQPRGFARSRLRRPYVSAFDPRDPPGRQASAMSLIGASGHEIAHSDLFGGNDGPGLHHPWDPDSPLKSGPSHPLMENGLVPFFPEDNYTLVDQISDQLRLMWPQNLTEPNPKTGRYPSMLLRQEIDKLHEHISSKKEE